MCSLRYLTLATNTFSRVTLGSTTFVSLLSKRSYWLISREISLTTLCQITRGLLGLGRTLLSDGKDGGDNSPKPYFPLFTAPLFMILDLEKELELAEGVPLRECHYRGDFMPHICGFLSITLRFTCMYLFLKRGTWLPVDHAFKCFEWWHT